MRRKKTQEKRRVMENRMHGLAHGVNASSNRAAFTLIELLVVIAIISLLVSILLPTLNQAKTLAKMAVCMSNLRSNALAANLYCEDEETFPTRSYFNTPMASPIPANSDENFRAYGLLLTSYLDNNAITLFCPMSAWIDTSQLPAWYPELELRHGILPQDMNLYTGYFYFGNYASSDGFLVKAFGELDDYDLFMEGKLYPQNNATERAKLFQDLTGSPSSHYTYCGHNGNNTGEVHSAYSDGSVEKENIDDLKCYIRLGRPLWW